MSRIWFSSFSRFFKVISCAPAAVNNVELPTPLKVATDEAGLLDADADTSDVNAEEIVLDESEGFKTTPAHIGALVAPVIVAFLYIYYATLMAGNISING